MLKKLALILGIVTLIAVSGCVISPEESDSSEDSTEVTASL